VDGRNSVVAVRSYLLANRPVFTGEDIAEATPYLTNDITVHVRMTAEAAVRFQSYTAANVKRRLAILVRGRVVSAPVVAREIVGGFVVITMGAGTRAEQAEESRALAAALNGR
jgi:preprotein translocase subunit SecD